MRGTPNSSLRWPSPELRERIDRLASPTLPSIGRAVERASSHAASNLAVAGPSFLEFHFLEFHCGHAQRNPALVCQSGASRVPSQRDVQVERDRRLPDDVVWRCTCGATARLRSRSSVRGFPALTQSEPQQGSSGPTRLEDTATLSMSVERSYRGLYEASGSGGGARRER
jgi:hypothetical protein